MLILGSTFMRKRGSIQSQQIYANGDNSFYQLGNGESINRSSPVLVTTTGTVSYSKSWKTLSAGYGAFLALNSDGEMYVWGDNTYGQWGIGNNTDAPTDAPRAANRSSPTFFPTASGLGWNTVSIGRWSYVATDEIYPRGATTYGGVTIAGIQTDGTLWTWGSNRRGPLGTLDDAVTPLTRSSPVQVGTDTDWTDVSVGVFHVLGIRGGQIYSWGDSDFGVLGMNDTISRSSPVAVLAGPSFASVIATGNKSFGIDTSGQMYFAGVGSFYPESTVSVNRSSFVAVTGMSNVYMTSLGPTFGLVIKSTGGLYAAGQNTYGQLGNSSVVSRSSFVQVGAATNWSKVKVSTNHALALTTTGNLYAWGRNQGGQLGTGDNVNRSSPVLVATGVADIGASLYTSFWLKSDGTLWATGSRSDGAGAADVGILGDALYLMENDVPSNLFYDRSSPVQIGSGYDPAYFKFESDYVRGQICKFLYNDDLYIWGNNEAGEYTWDKSPPAKYSKFAGSWTAVSAGTYHCSAIKTDGTLWAWGSGAGGALGVNSTLNKYSPVQVGADTDWVDISCGSSFTVGLKSTEGSGYALYLWGYNGQGQLGQNIVTNRSSPISLGSSGGIGWQTVKAGAFHTWGLDTSGNLYVWGYNNNGQLGTNSTISRSNPYLVGTPGVGTILAPSATANYGHYISPSKKLFSTGLNAYGQLGDSSSTNRSNFTQVGTSSWSVVSAGLNHSGGITSDGRLFVWGRNLTGQIAGLDPAVYPSKNSPILIGSRSSWTLVAAGSISATNGTTWAVLKTTI